MHKLLKESMKVYNKFQSLGPKYLDTFDSRPIVEATMEAVKTKSLQEYIKREFRPEGEVSMLPIHVEPDHRLTVAVFAIMAGTEMPLHDHPNMFVLTHVMSGVGERESWDVAAEEEEKCIDFRKSRSESKLVKAIEYPRIPLNEGDNCFTRPTVNNLHRFINVHINFNSQKSEKELFVFLDVILPHYNEMDRVISFYEPTGKNQLELLHAPKQYQRHPIRDIDIRDFVR